jgi:hypothetical protein
MILFGIRLRWNSILTEKENEIHSNSCGNQIREWSKKQFTAFLEKYQLCCENEIE